MEIAIVQWDATLRERTWQRFLMAGATCIGLASASPTATAQDATSRRDAPNAVETARLERELAFYAAEGRRERIAMLATSLACGAVLLPAGIVLSERSDAELNLFGLGLIIGGSAQLFGVPFFLIASPMERVSARHHERATSAETDPALLRNTEDDWARAATESRLVRTSVGVVYAALGVAAVPTGLVFLLAQPGVFGMSREPQYNWGSALVGAGVPFVTIGLQLLLRESLAETSWRAHGLAKSSQLQAGRVLPRALSVGMLPTRGGAMVGAEVRF
jgi:hypothetical protein